MSESKSRSSSLHPDSFQKPGSARRAIRGGLFKAIKRTFRRWGLLSFLALICLGLGILASQTITSFKQFAEEQAKIDTNVLAPQIKTLEDQISKLKAERADYLSKNGILDPGEQRTKSKNRISFLETQLDQLNIASTGFKSELEHIKKRQQQAHIDISQKKIEEERDELVQDAVADSRRRQDRINQLLKEEEIRIELEATLTAKEKEKALIDDLVKQNKTGKIDQVKLENEILILKARLNGNYKTQAYSNEMMKLDKIIVPDSKKTPKSFFAEKVMFSFYESKMTQSLKFLLAWIKSSNSKRNWTPNGAVSNCWTRRLENPPNGI